jgi:hypothetical protein
MCRIGIPRDVQQSGVGQMPSVARLGVGDIDVDVVPGQHQQNRDAHSGKVVGRVGQVVAFGEVPPIGRHPVGGARALCVTVRGVGAVVLQIPVAPDEGGIDLGG